MKRVALFLLTNLAVTLVLAAGVTADPESVASAIPLTYFSNDA